VRLGGIYALERIARDSDQDRATIAEVMTAFISGRALGRPADRTSSARTRLSREIPFLRYRATDGQAALTALGRQPNVAASQLLNLSDTHLRRADLSDANLKGARLLRARLQGANIRAAELEGVNLRQARLREARSDAKTV
jgi:Pentapeptide repeats (8 copies)